MALFAATYFMPDVSYLPTEIVSAHSYRETDLANLPPSPPLRLSMQLASAAAAMHLLSFADLLRAMVEVRVGKGLPQRFSG